MVNKNYSMYAIKSLAVVTLSITVHKAIFIGWSELTVAHSLDEILESLCQFSRLQTQGKEMVLYILSVKSLIITWTS